MNTIELQELIQTIPGWSLGEAVAQTHAEYDRAIIAGKFIKEDTRCACCHEVMEAGEGFRWHQKAAVARNPHSSGRPARWVHAHSNGICVALKTEWSTLRYQADRLADTIEIMSRLAIEHPAARVEADSMSLELEQVRNKMAVIQSQFAKPLI